MNRTLRICLFLLVVSSPSQSQWIIDTTSPQTFTPLAVGNEWVYQDSMYIAGSPPYIWDNTQIERTVRITDHVFVDSINLWLASVAEKGIVTHNGYIVNDDGSSTFGTYSDTIDTLYTDTLRMISDTLFSKGLVSLFGWLNIPESDTDVQISYSQRNDTSIMNLLYSESFYNVSGGGVRICAAASIGMVYLKNLWGSRSGSSKEILTKLIRFNNKDINWQELSPVKMAGRRPVLQTTTPAWKRLCTFREYCPTGKSAAAFNLSGQKTVFDAGRSAGISIVRKPQNFPGK